MSHEPVDTRVTAYVFDELSADAAAQFERELEKSSQLQEEVAAIRETVGAVRSEFRSQACDVSDLHRESIERAIEQRSESPLPAAAPEPPLNSPLLPDQTSYRRLFVAAALAASGLIVVVLAYPHLLGPATVATKDTSNIVVANQNLGSSAGVDAEISSLVASFNELIEQRRYDEADVVAQLVNEMKPGGPIGVTLLNTSRMSRQMIDDHVEHPLRLDPPAIAAAKAVPDLAPLDPPDSALPGTLKTSQQPGQQGGQASLSDSFGQADGAALGGVANRGIANPELKQQGDVASVETTRPNSRQPSVEDFGSRPSKSEAGESKDVGQPLLAGSAGGSRQDSNGDGTEIDELDVQSIDNLRLLGQPRHSRRSHGGMGMEEQTDMEAIIENGGMDMAMGMAMGEMAMSGFGLAPGVQGNRFQPITDNAFVAVSQSPVSTFSIDVDTASYAKVRALLNQNTLPPPAAVRIEEFLNYFDYDYTAPNGDHPFAASMELAACPWNPKHRLARIGIQGEVIEADRPASNLVFLLDVSGSMNEPGKLPLVIDGMKMLTHQLTENDKVAIVVYAGAAGLVLDSTRGDKKRPIIRSLDELRAGGSTNGRQGIMLAYDIARDNFIVGGTNRVILCTDGDFNVGVTGTDQLVKVAQENAKSNIFLSVLGFGTGNQNDAMMEQISNKGNGNYAFIDRKSEAKKVLVEELGSTLVTIAKDVKIQVEFNPKQVASYRLIGYENRMLAGQDFDDDTKDAAEIGAGHTITALYEIVPAEMDDAEVQLADNLRYQQPVQLSQQADSGETLVLKLRYKQPQGDTSTLIEIPVTDSGKRFSQTDRDFKFAAAVAAFGMLLRDSPHKGEATFASVYRIAREGARGDDFGFRTEFVDLVTTAKQLRGE